MGKYSVEITNINTNNLKVLSNDEMISLFKRYQNNDLSAKEEIINGNLRLVLSILKRFNNKNYNLDDLFQIGVIGLIKAVENFDLSFNCLFSTYAVPLILGEIKRYVRDYTPLRISRGIKDNSYLIMKYIEEKENSNQKIDIDKMSKDLNLSIYDIKLAIDSLKEVSSIYEPIFNDQGDTIYLFDQISDKAKDKDTLIELYSSLEKIKKREKEVIEKRYIVGMTQSEIASSLNISQAQVSRIEKSALKSLRRLLN